MLKPSFSHSNNFKIKTLIFCFNENLNIDFNSNF